MERALTPPPRALDLLEEHPWPRAHQGGNRLEWRWQVDLACDRDTAWSLISDVSRLNRALGNPEMHFREEGGLRHGKARYGGLVHEWHEVPWDWVAGHWFTQLRLYSRGAMKTLYGIHRLEPLGEGRTRLHVYYGVVPRWSLLVPAIKLNFAMMRRAYERVIPELARQAPGRLRPPQYQLEAPSLGPREEARLAGIEGELRRLGLDHGIVGKLVDHVRRGDELELTRIQVRERARAWGVSEDELLRTCLHATRAGLLDLSWDVVCPHCRGVRDSEQHLAKLEAEGSCEVCAVTFGTADAIEVSFRVHPSIREVTPRLWCSAEPATKQHVVVQRTLEPGLEDALGVELKPGRYRLRKRGASEVAGYVDVTAGASVAEVAFSSVAPAGEQAVRSPARLNLRNESPGPETFVVEDAQPADLALKPGRLLSHPEFRDLFSDEFLASDVGLSVGQQTIVFTDIVGSTAMYAERGDPGAFVAVRQHFTQAFAVVAKHKGAVIKTIGDAVMAAFTQPVDALEAARELQFVFGKDAPIHLRISLNTGACIAVKLNANLDYFGGTVNLAAKLQAAAEAGEIALSVETLAAPGARAWLEEQGAQLEPVTIKVKGVGELEARRWKVW